MEVNAKAGIEIDKATKIEVYIRKALGILLILLILAPMVFIGLSALPIFGVFLFYLVIAIPTGIYLLKSKGRHLVLDASLALLGALMYFYFIPFTGVPPVMLKGLVLAADWSESFSMAFFPLTASKILVFGASVFSLIGDILARNRVFARPSRRGPINLAILLSILVVLFGAPFLRPVVFIGSPQGTATTISSGPGPSPVPGGSMPFSIGFEDTSVSLDSEDGLWTYQIAARNQLSDDAEIVEIVTLRPPSKGLFNIVSEKKRLAPPFGEGIEVTGGEETSERIIVKPGSTLTLRVFSKDPLISISLVEKRVRYDIGFWSFAEEYSPTSPANGQGGTEPEIVEALDPSVKVFLASAVPPTPETFKTNFAAGEPIYPQERGLAKGIRYGFRIVGTAGEVIVPLDLGHLEEVRGGAGAEGYGTFNSEELPLPPGSYRTELIKVEDGKGIIVAYENFSVYSGC